MHLDSNNIEKYLKKLNESSSPKWGTLHPSQMLYHCNSFIEVSLGLKKINLITRLSSRLFFRYFFLKYLNYIDFNIYKFKHIFLHLHSSKKGRVAQLDRASAF